jgi:hypothetical protein
MFIQNEAAILKNDPKRAEDIEKAKQRVKEQLDPIIAQRKQLEQVAAGMAPIQNLPGQSSGSASDTVIRYNAKGEVIK